MQNINTVQTPCCGLKAPWKMISTVIIMIISHSNLQAQWQLIISENAFIRYEHIATVSDKGTFNFVTDKVINNAVDVTNLMKKLEVTKSEFEGERKAKSILEEIKLKLEESKQEPQLLRQDESIEEYIHQFHLLPSDHFWNDEIRSAEIVVDNNRPIRVYAIGQANSQMAIIYLPQKLLWNASTLAIQIDGMIFNFDITDPQGVLKKRNERELKKRNEQLLLRTKHD